MTYSAEEKSYIWLDSFPIEPLQKNKWLGKNSPVWLVKRFAEQKPFLDGLGKGDLYERMAATLQDNGAYFRALTERLEKEKIVCIAKSHPLYPTEWKTLADAPLCLYAKGNTQLLQSRRFTVVGSRKTTDAVAKLARKVCEELSRSFVVVTGTADGGDGAAAQGALDGSGNVVCLLAGGFGHIPQGNAVLLKRVAEEGLLLAVHSWDTPVLAYSYEYRNKLLALLGEGTLVISAGEKSGALITAGYAEEYGKPIFAFPYPPNAVSGAGCNALIKKGAYLTENSVDILGRFGINWIKETDLPTLTATERAVLDELKGLGESHISALSQKTGISPFQLTAVLSALEIKGLVAKCGGNRFVSV